MRKTLNMDVLDDYIIDASTTPGAPRTRKLRAGEWVDVSEAGIEGMKLSGRGLEVAEFFDGSTSLVYAEGLDRILNGAALLFLLSVARALRGVEVRIMRRIVGLTQADLAALLGISRDTMIELEKRPTATIQESLAVRHLLARHLRDFVGDWRVEKGRKSEPAMDRIAAGMTSMATPQDLVLLPRPGLRIVCGDVPKSAPRKPRSPRHADRTITSTRVKST